MPEQGVRRAANSFLAASKAAEEPVFNFPGGNYKRHKRAPTPGRSVPCAMCKGRGFMPCKVCKQYTCHVFDKNKRKSTISVATLSRTECFGNVTFMLPEYGGELFSVAARTDVSILILPRDQAMAALRAVASRTPGVECSSELRSRWCRPSPLRILCLGQLPQFKRG